MRLLSLAVVAAACAHPSALDALKRESNAVKPLLRTELTRAFVEQVQSLKPPGTHVVWRDKTRAFSEQAWAALSAEEKKGLERQELDEEYFFTTKYGSALSYVLALEKLPLDSVQGLKVLDYGYGYITHLKLLQALGADARGVDADPLLPVLYAGEHVYGGRFPDDAELVRAIGQGYGLFLSKNTLKMGFVHPSQPHERTLKLKASDDEYLAAVAALLEPKGWALVYNIYPAQKPDYIPWAEGKTPFPREAWERAGFEVLELDRDDTARCREVARALGWDKGEDAMDLEHDLFATYTLARKR